VKALSVRQPWAQFLVTPGSDGRAVKWIETRSRQTHYRGRLVIHSAMKWGIPELTQTYSEFSEADIFQRLFGCDPDQVPGSQVLVSDDGSCWRVAFTGPQWTRGAVIGSVEVVDCFPITTGWSVESVSQVKHRVDNHTLWVHRAGYHMSGADEVTDQLRYGDFSDRQWAWILGDPAPVADRCPWCWGEGTELPCGPDPEQTACRICDGVGRCAPIPVKGQQSTPWEWRP
jgi:hypothetical protein